MKKNKKLLSFLLIALSSIFCIGSLNLKPRKASVSADGTEKAPGIYTPTAYSPGVGSYLYFGEYPQTEMSDSFNFDSSKYTLETSTGYYVANEDIKSTDGLITYLKAGEKIHKYSISADLDSKYPKERTLSSGSTKGSETINDSDRNPRKLVTDKTSIQASTSNSGNQIVTETGTDYSTSKSYYFKVEPIKWVITSTSGGNYTLVSTLVLDSIDYNLYDSNGNIWTYSYARNWLNSGSSYTQNQYGVLEYNTSEVGNRRYATSSYSGYEAKLNFYEWFDYKESSFSKTTNTNQYYEMYYKFDRYWQLFGSDSDGYSDYVSGKTGSYNKVSYKGVSIGSRNSKLQTYSTLTGSKSFYNMAFNGVTSYINSVSASSKGNFPTADGKYSTVSFTAQNGIFWGSTTRTSKYSNGVNYQNTTSENYLPHPDSSKIKSTTGDRVTNRSVSHNDYVRLVSKANVEKVTGYSDYAVATGFSATVSDTRQNLNGNNGYIWTLETDNSDTGYQKTMGSGVATAIHNTKAYCQLTFDGGGTVTNRTTVAGNADVNTYLSMDQSYGVVPQITIKERYVKEHMQASSSGYVVSGEVGAGTQTAVGTKVTDIDTLKVGSFANDYAANVSVEFGVDTKENTSTANGTTTKTGYTIYGVAKDLNEESKRGKILIVITQNALTTTQLNSKVFPVNSTTKYIYLSSDKVNYSADEKTQFSVSLDITDPTKIHMYAFYMTDDCTKAYAVGDSTNGISQLEKYSYTVYTYAESDGKFPSKPSDSSNTKLKGETVSFETGVTSDGVIKIYFTSESDAKYYMNNKRVIPTSPAGTIYSSTDTETHDIKIENNVTLYYVTTASRGSLKVGDYYDGVYYLGYNDSDYYYPSQSDSSNTSQAERPEVLEFIQSQTVTFKVYFKYNYVKALKGKKFGTAIDKSTGDITLKVDEAGKELTPVYFTGTDEVVKEYYYEITTSETGYDCIVLKFDESVKNLFTDDKYSITLEKATDNHILLDNVATKSGNDYVINNIAFDQDVNTTLQTDIGYYFPVTVNNSNSGGAETKTYKVPDISFNYVAAVKDALGYRMTDTATYSSGKYAGQFIRVAKNGAGIEFDEDGNRKYWANMTINGALVPNLPLTRDNTTGGYEYDGTINETNYGLKLTPVLKLNIVAKNGASGSVTNQELTWDGSTNVNAYVLRGGSGITHYVEFTGQGQDKVKVYIGNNKSSAISFSVQLSQGDEVFTASNTNYDVSVIIAGYKCEYTYGDGGTYNSFGDNLKKSSGYQYEFSGDYKNGTDEINVTMNIIGPNTKYYTPWVEYVESALDYYNSDKTGVRSINNTSLTTGTASFSSGVNKVWFKKSGGVIALLDTNAINSIYSNINKDTFTYANGNNLYFCVDAINVTAQYNESQNEMKYKFSFPSIVGDIKFSVGGVEQYSYVVKFVSDCSGADGEVEAVRYYAKHGVTGLFKNANDATQIEGFDWEGLNSKESFDIPNITTYREFVTANGKGITVFTPIVLGNKYYYACPNISSWTPNSEKVKYKLGEAEYIYYSWNGENYYIKEYKSGDEVLYLLEKDGINKQFKSTALEFAQKFVVVDGYGFIKDKDNNILTENAEVTLADLSTLQFEFTNTYATIKFKAVYETLSNNVEISGFAVPSSEVGGEIKANDQGSYNPIEVVKATGAIDGTGYKVKNGNYYLPETKYGAAFETNAKSTITKVEELVQANFAGKGTYLGLFRGLSVDLNNSGFSYANNVITPATGYSLVYVNAQEMYANADKNKIYSVSVNDDGELEGVLFVKHTDSSIYYSTDVTLVTLFELTKYNVTMNYNGGTIKKDHVIDGRTAFTVNYSKSTFDGTVIPVDYQMTINFGNAYNQTVLTASDFAVTVGGNTITASTASDENPNYGFKVEGSNGKYTLSIYHENVTGDVVISLNKTIEINKYNIKFSGNTGNEYGTFKLSGTAVENGVETLVAHGTVISFEFVQSAKYVPNAIAVSITYNDVTAKLTLTAGQQETIGGATFTVSAKDGVYTVTMSGVLEGGLSVVLDSTSAKVKVYTISDGSSNNIDSSLQERQKDLIGKMFTQTINGSDLSNNSNVTLEYGKDVTLVTTLNNNYSSAIVVYNINNYYLIASQDTNAVNAIKSALGLSSTATNVSGLASNKFEIGGSSATYTETTDANNWTSVRTLVFGAQLLENADLTLSIRTLIFNESGSQNNAASNKVNYENNLTITGERTHGTWNLTVGDKTGPAGSINTFTYLPKAEYTHSLPEVTVYGYKFIIPWGTNANELEKNVDSYDYKYNDSSSSGKSYWIKTSASGNTYTFEYYVASDNIVGATKNTNILTITINAVFDQSFTAEYGFSYDKLLVNGTAYTFDLMLVKFKTSESLVEKYTISDSKTHEENKYYVGFMKVKSDGTRLGAVKDGKTVYFEEVAKGDHASNKFQKAGTPIATLNGVNYYVFNGDFGTELGYTTSTITDSSNPSDENKYYLVYSNYNNSGNNTKYYFDQNVINAHTLLYVVYTENDYKLVFDGTNSNYITYGNFYQNAGAGLTIIDDMSTTTTITHTRVEGLIIGYSVKAGYDKQVPTFSIYFTDTSSKYGTLKVAFGGAFTCSNSALTTKTSVVVADEKYLYELYDASSNETILSFTITRITIDDADRAKNNQTVKYEIEFTSKLLSEVKTNTSIKVTLDDIDSTSGFTSINKYTLKVRDTLFRMIEPVDADLQSTLNAEKNKIDNSIASDYSYLTQNDVKVDSVLKNATSYYMLIDGSWYELKAGQDLKDSTDNYIMTEYYVETSKGSSYSHASTSKKPSDLGFGNIRGYSFKALNNGNVVSVEGDNSFVLYDDVTLSAVYEANKVTISYASQLRAGVSGNIGGVISSSGNQIGTIESVGSNPVTFGDSITFVVKLNNAYSLNELKFSVTNDNYAIVTYDSYVDEVYYSGVSKQGKTRTYTVTVKYFDGSNLSLGVEASNETNTTLQTNYTGYNGTTLESNKIYTNAYAIDFYTPSEFDYTNEQVTLQRETKYILHNTQFGSTDVNIITPSFEGWTFAGWYYEIKENGSTEENVVKGWYSNNVRTITSDATKLENTTRFYESDAVYAHFTRKEFKVTVYYYDDTYRGDANGENSFVSGMNGEYPTFGGNTKYNEVADKVLYKYDFAELLDDYVISKGMTDSSIIYDNTVYVFYVTPANFNAFVSALNSAESVADLSDSELLFNDNSSVVTEELYVIRVYYRNAVELTFAGEAGKAEIEDTYSSKSLKYGELIPQEYFEEVEEQTTCSAGYHVDGWLIGSSLWDATYVVQEDVTIKAKVEPNNYKIKFTTSSGEFNGFKVNGVDKNLTTDEDNSYLEIKFDNNFTAVFETDGNSHIEPDVKVPYALTDGYYSIASNGTNKYSITFNANIFGTYNDGVKFENNAEIEVKVTAVYGLATAGHSGSTTADATGKITGSVNVDGEGVVGIDGVVETVGTVRFLYLQCEDASNNSTANIKVYVHKSYNFNSTYKFTLTDSTGTSKEYVIDNDKLSDYVVEGTEYYVADITFENIKGDLKFALDSATEIRNNDFTITFKVMVGGGVAGWREITVNGLADKIAYLSKGWKIETYAIPSLGEVFDGMTNGSWYKEYPTNWFKYTGTGAINWSNITSKSDFESVPANTEVVFNGNTTLYALIFVDTVNVSTTETSQEKAYFNAGAQADMHDSKMTFDGYTFKYVVLHAYSKNIPILTIGGKELVLLPYNTYKNMAVNETVTAGNYTVTRTESGYSYQKLGSDAVEVKVSNSALYTIESMSMKVTPSTGNGDAVYTITLNSIASPFSLASNRDEFTINKYKITYVLPDGTKKTEEVEHEKKLVTIPEVSANFLQKVTYKITYSDGTTETVKLDSLKGIALKADATVEIVVSINLPILISIIVAAVAVIVLTVVIVIKSRNTRLYKAKASQENTDAFAKLKEQQEKQKKDNDGENGPVI